MPSGCRAYISGKALVPMLQLLHVHMCTKYVYTQRHMCTPPIMCTQITLYHARTHMNATTHTHTPTWTYARIQQYNQNQGDVEQHKEHNTPQCHGELSHTYKEVEHMQQRRWGWWGIPYNQSMGWKTLKQHTSRYPTMIGSENHIDQRILADVLQ